MIENPCEMEIRPPILLTALILPASIVLRAGEALNLPNPSP
jgi:hypothetical protein